MWRTLVQVVGCKSESRKCQANKSTHDTHTSLGEAVQVNEPVPLRGTLDCVCLVQWEEAFNVKHCARCMRQVTKLWGTSVSPQSPHPCTPNQPTKASSPYGYSGAYKYWWDDKRDADMGGGGIDNTIKASSRPQRSWSKKKKKSLIQASVHQPGITPHFLIT